MTGPFEGKGGGMSQPVGVAYYSKVDDQAWEVFDPTGKQVAYVYEEPMAQRVSNMLNGALPWRPIEELYVGGYKYDKYDHNHDSEAGFLLLAPELVDEDCNIHGVGMGYYQDDGKLYNMSREEIERLNEAHGQEDHGSWMACKWSMTNDEWSHICCNPTHYLKLKGLNK